MAIDPTTTEGVAACLADFAALLLRDLCEACSLSAEQQARVLGNAPDVVAVEDAALAEAALEDRRF